MPKKGIPKVNWVSKVSEAVLEPFRVEAWSDGNFKKFAAADYLSLWM